MGRASLRPLLGLRVHITRSPSTFRSPRPIRMFNSTPPFVETPKSQAQKAYSPSQPAASSQPPANTSLPAPSESFRNLLPLLASQPSHYITIHLHGKPYLVTPGDSVRLPFKMPGVLPGDVLRLNRASILGSRDFTLKGSPYINESLFECRAVVLGTETEPMRVKIKKKRRNRRKKHVRSKHSFTVLRIQDLKISTLEL